MEPFPGQLIQIIRSWHMKITTHRFSDHFQDMHQKKIIQQNRELEQMVKKRTAAFQESEKKSWEMINGG